jgi:CRISPR-associated protein Csm4
LKLYAITIKPTSGFGTAFKGDTIFGHFCWQAAYDATLLDGGLDRQIACYPEKPFAVFSSAFPKLINNQRTTYLLKRPELPFSFLVPAQKDKAADMRQKKDFKKKKWMAVDATLLLDMKTARFMSDRESLSEVQSQLAQKTRRLVKKTELPEFMKGFSQSHNTINRMTQTTGTGMFSPYAKENHYYFPETELVVFVLIEESATDIDRVKLGLERIGTWGFGRDASTGLGRFEVCASEELPLPVLNGTNACYALAPCVPGKDTFKDAFFTPFIRFGKHGDKLASYGNPFKNPVIMADEGAVLIPMDIKAIQKPYVGQAVTKVSKSMPRTVVQGYAPYLPLEMEISDEANI